MRSKALSLTLPLALPMILALAACTDSGHVKIPFEKEAPFIPSAIPADFAIKVDENHDTFYSRQHIAQEISVSDSMSTTTYTTFRDLNNGVSNHFSQETPLKPEQLQAMWNAVSRYNLLNRSTPWINWYSGADLYKHDSNTIQIRANGQTAIYHQNNGFAGAVRPLVLQVQAVRLPISQNANTQLVTPPESAPVVPPISPTLETTTQPSLPGSPLMPDTAPGTPPRIAPATQAITPMEPPKFTPDNIKNATPPK